MAVGTNLYKSGPPSAPQKQQRRSRRERIIGLTGHTNREQYAIFQSAVRGFLAEVHQAVSQKA
jgi:hypothetical protein